MRTLAEGIPASSESIELSLRSHTYKKKSNYSDEELLKYCRDKHVPQQCLRVFGLHRMMLWPIVLKTTLLSKTHHEAFIKPAVCRHHRDQAAVPWNKKRSSGKAANGSIGMNPSPQLLLYFSRQRQTEAALFSPVSAAVLLPRLGKSSTCVYSCIRMYTI